MKQDPLFYFARINRSPTHRTMPRLIHRPTAHPFLSRPHADTDNAHQTASPTLPRQHPSLHKPLPSRPKRRPSALTVTPIRPPRTRHISICPATYFSSYFMRFTHINVFVSTYLFAFPIHLFDLCPNANRHHFPYFRRLPTANTHLPAIRTDKKTRTHLTKSTCLFYFACKNIPYRL